MAVRYSTTKLKKASTTTTIKNKKKIIFIKTKKNNTNNTDNFIKEEPFHFNFGPDGVNPKEILDQIKSS